MRIRLGARMRELRRSGGITQEELANALNVTAQAVSRWENGTCYPDMELIPPMANYFGVTIDSLFGYDEARTQRITALADRVDAMNRLNNGADVCMDECIALAREALAEYPGSERLTLSLASALFNAGYVRRGEQHIDDADGYDAYDTARHREYPEWREAIALYEGLLTMEPGSLRHRAVRELMQLYANTGMTERAQQLADAAPDISGCRELLRIHALSGRARAQAYDDAAAQLAGQCADLIVAGVMAHREHITPQTAARRLRDAIALLEHARPEHDADMHSGRLYRLHLYLSEFLWVSGEGDAAFGALDAALRHARAHDERTGGHDVALLPDDWPWWQSPDYAAAKAEISADPRWAEWAQRARE